MRGEEGKHVRVNECYEMCDSVGRSVMLRAGDGGGGGLYCDDPGPAP